MERIDAIERNILCTLHQLTPEISPTQIIRAGTSNRATKVIEKTPRAFWANGDVILAWRPFDMFFSLQSEYELLRNFRENWNKLRQTDVNTSLIISPTIQLDSQIEVPHGSVSDARLPINREHSSHDHDYDIRATDETSHLLERYILQVYSRSPILDLQSLYWIADLLTKNLIDLENPNPVNLPPGIDAEDAAILLLVLALGHVVSFKHPCNQPIEHNHYIRLALPWLGFASFNTRDPIKALQAEFLLASYYMWTMRHWEAWCLADSMASRAEKLLLRYKSFG